MFKEVKKSYIVFNTILSFGIVFLLINIFVIKNVNFLFNAILPTVLFLLFFFIYGYEKKNKRFTYETMFYVFAYTVLFLLATYIVGIFTGFTSSIYHIDFKHIIHIVLPYLLIIISSEYLRSEVVRKCDTSILAYILITVLLILIDCSLYLTTFDISSGDGQIHFICNILLPSASKNILLLYLSRIGGVYPTLIYRLLMEVKQFIIPIFPDYGEYIDCIVSTVYPVALGFLIMLSLKQYQNKEVDGKELRQSKLYTYSTFILTMILVGVIVTLTSCKFKYGAVAIGSGSMTGTINKGDVVIYKRLDDYVVQNGDVIVFNKENKRIVHRVIEIIEVNDGEYIYYTQGDANPTPDGYPLTRDDLIGVVKTRVKYIGIPSVGLSELLSRK